MYHTSFFINIVLFSGNIMLNIFSTGAQTMQTLECFY